MIYRTIAQLARCWPRFGELVIQSAMKRPYYDLDGYMQRWWLTPSWLMTRDENGHAVPYQWLPMALRARLHFTKRGDLHPEMHDHPADNVSVVLAGYFVEVTVDGKRHRRGAGACVRRRAEEFHRIESVGPSGCYSLWFQGRKRNGWGFLTTAGLKVPHAEMENYRKGKKAGQIGQRENIYNFPKKPHRGSAEA